MAGFALGLLLMMPGHALGATGAGDVKLMAAVGAIVGPGLVVSAFLFTAIAGGILAILVALVIMSVIMAVVGALACAAPARRALRVQPTEALRQG